MRSSVKHENEPTTILFVDQHVSNHANASEFDPSPSFLELLKTCKNQVTKKKKTVQKDIG